MFLDVAIRPARPDDLIHLAEIYNYYVEHTAITFEEVPINGASMHKRLEEVARYSLPWLVVAAGDSIAGFAYANRWKTRAAYRYSVEVSVYVKHSARGQGLGAALYQALLQELRERKIHAAIGGIALPNEASVALHEKMGFEKVAHFKDVGNKFGRWIDVGYWQILL